MRKIGIKSIVELVRYAVRNRFTEPWGHAWPRWAGQQQCCTASAALTTADFEPRRPMGTNTQRRYSGFHEIRIIEITTDHRRKFQNAAVARSRV